MDPAAQRHHSARLQNGDDGSSVLPDSPHHPRFSLSVSANAKHSPLFYLSLYLLIKSKIAQLYPHKLPTAEVGELLCVCEWKPLQRDLTSTQRL